MKKLSILLFIIVLTSTSIHAGAGILEGYIYEQNKGSKEPLPFANVVVKGTTIGTTTDFDGNFSLKLEEGVYTIEVSFIGYQAVEKQVEVSAEGKLNIEIQLQSDTQMLESVVIKGKADRQVESVLLLEQKKAAVISQNIGANELSRKGVSNVAAGLAKVSGVSKMGSRKIFVRGLGDRYNNATLNGLPIASPDPEMKIVPLEIFPTEVVKNLALNKAFSAHMYADFSGGNINIETKDYPEEKFLKVGVSTGYNSQATFKDFKKATKFSRALPKEVANQNYISTYQTEALFNSDFNYKTISTPLNTGLSVLAGTTYKLGGRDLGVLLSAAYNKSYEYYNAIDITLDTEGAKNVDYSGQEYTIKDNTSLLANFYYPFNSNHILQYNLLFLNTTNNNLEEYTGYDSESDYLTIRRSTFRESKLLNNQLIGAHEKLLGNDRWRLDWATSYAIAGSAEPDRRQLVYIKSDEEKFKFHTLDESYNNRFFGELSENEWSGRLKFTFTSPNELTGSPKPLSIDFGTQFKLKDRDYRARQFNYDLSEIDEAVSVDDPSLYFNEEIFEKGLVRFREQPNISKHLLC